MFLPIVESLKNTWNCEITLAVNGEKKNLSMQALRERIQAGMEIEQDSGEACACLNPVDAEDDHGPTFEGPPVANWLVDSRKPSD